VPNNDPYFSAGEELKDCLQLVSRGDQPAFARLLRAYWNKIYTQALTYLKDQGQAMEITQDVFYKIWAAREKLPELENFSNYLFIVSRNEIISALRKKAIPFTDPTEQLAANLLRPDEQLDYKQTQERLLKAIDLLPPTRKHVFKMSRLEGRSYEEIGKELGISRNGVKDHIVKALNFLRNQVSQWDKEKGLFVFITTEIFFN
jgi:RNA polymerase sigma-70 factor (ECF subfamily)